jgi:CheY-like chemotaxis protein
MQRSQRILVVDDEPVMREFLLEVFAGHDPMGVADGSAALQILAEQPFALIISDLKMPGLSGLELLRKIRQDFGQAKVIIITGYASEQTESECMQAGASDFLKKPFSIGEIREAVRRVLH